MEIKKRYLEKYLHDIAIEQIAEEYQQKGYKISKEEQLGSYRADLIARKGNETIVIEIKSGRMTPERKLQISELANYVRNHSNYKFLIVIATPPKDKKLEISDIKDLLAKKINIDFPSILDELSTHSRLEEVTDINIDEIIINRNTIFVSGDGAVSLELQFGSFNDQNHDNGIKNYDSFPFEFEITLEYNSENKLQITKVDKLEFDTSSYDIDVKKENNT